MKPRPNTLSSDTWKIVTSCGNLYITVTYETVGEEKLPMETFLALGKAGSCSRVFLESVGRLIALALRSGVELSSVAETLRGMSCPQPFFDKEIVERGSILSCIDALAKVLAKYTSKEMPK